MSLLGVFDALVASAAIPSSTIPSSPAVDNLRAFLDLALHARSGQAESAMRLNAKRAEQADVVRGRIRAAVGVLPLSMPLVQLVAAVEKRLQAKGQSAGRWQIEDELRQLRKEARAASDTEANRTLVPPIVAASGQRGRCT